jgi:CubicO group peptidase (beta-lactamase class C family)
MMVEGNCDPSFERIRELFLSGVASGRERGALCVRLEGRTVIDLWGGMADPKEGRPWTKTTLACCFSVSKGVFALMVHSLVDRELLDINQSVASLWPEFAQAGKREITVGDVLNHRAGLPAVDANEVAAGSLYSTATMERLLEASAPVVPARSHPVYHNMTYGFLVGGVCARALGVPVEEIIHQELCLPLRADVHFGMSREAQARCARLSQEDPTALFKALDDAPASLFSRSMAFFARNEDFNSSRWRAAVIGSGNGHATAEGLARLYEQFNRQSVLLSQDRRTALRCQSGRSDGDDPILGIPIRYGQGIEISNPPGLDFGPSEGTVGYWGAGGAQAFADDEAGLAFGYLTGHMDAAMGTSQRVRELISELYNCL